MDSNNNQQKDTQDSSAATSRSDNLQRQADGDNVCGGPIHPTTDCFIPYNDIGPDHFLFRDKEGLLRLEPRLRPRPAMNWFDAVFGSNFEIQTLALVRNTDEAYLRKASAYFWANDVLSLHPSDWLKNRRQYIIHVNKPARLINPSVKTVAYLRKFFAAVRLEVESITVLKHGRVGGNMVDYINFNLYEE